jgi:lactoylglutathione lyase/glyoxylase I family protein
MSSNENNDEVDLFDLSAGAAPAAPVQPRPGFSPVETETNVFALEFDPAAAERKLEIPKPNIPPFTPTQAPAAPAAASVPDGSGAFLFEAKSPAARFAGLGGDDDDFDDDLPDLPDDDDDFPAQEGFVAKIVSAIGGLFKPKGGDFDDDLPDLPDDDDLPDLPDDDDDLPDLPDDDDLPDLPDDDGDFPSFGRKRGKDFDFDFDLKAAPAPAAPPPAAPAVAPIDEEESFDIGAAPIAAAPPAAVAKPDPGPDPVFGKIAHVCLTVKDLGRSIEYYTKLGFKKRFMFNKGGNIFGVYFEFGKGNFVELFEDAVTEFPRGRIAHFCLETPDIDAVTESLAKRGIEYTPKKLGCDSTYQIWLRDPDGNEFEVHQYTPGSSQIIGKDVEADW